MRSAHPQAQGGSLTGMSGFEWRRALIGLDPSWWVTRGNRHTVAVVVDSAVPGQPLLDVARLAGADPRLRVVFAAAPGPSRDAVEELLRGAAVVVPWPEFCEGDFGLVIAGSVPPGHRPGALGHLAEARGRRSGAPVIVLSDHAREADDASWAPVVFAFSHVAEQAVAGASTPGRRPPGTVVGDSTHDRLLASLPLRDFYRRALGVAPRQRLVAVALPPERPPDGEARARDVLHRLVSELPADEYYVLALPQPGPDPHPGCRGLARHLRKGLGLMPPETDWRAALVAADWIIGDHGPVARYGTITGAPVILSRPVDDLHAPDGVTAEMVSAVPRLSEHGPIRAQLRDAVTLWRPERTRAVVERITSEPGRFDRNIRRLMYGLLRLPQPATIPVADPVPPPFRLEHAADVLWEAGRGA